MDSKDILADLRGLKSTKVSDNNFGKGSPVSERWILSIVA